MFIEKILQAEGGVVRYVLAEDNNRPVWFFIELDPMRYQEYKKALKSSQVNIHQYGRILLRGLGEAAPESVRTFMRRKYKSEC